MLQALAPLKPKRPSTDAKVLTEEGFKIGQVFRVADIFSKRQEYTVVKVTKNYIHYSSRFGFPFTLKLMKHEFLNSVQKTAR